ncbi:hypothetical protein D0Y65_014269 [Glycine soja]|nr:hypothetical protein D0Y65_014269 [Glycine soja]RZC06732.1 hypothetical protein D0Y65_014269 [Glycine soja]
MPNCSPRKDEFPFLNFHFLNPIPAQIRFLESSVWQSAGFLFHLHQLPMKKMPLGLILGIGRAFRRKRPSSLDILSSKRAPRGYYKGKNCKPTGFHTRKGGYVVMQEKLPNYVVPDLSDFKLKPYVSQCPIEANTSEVS